MKILSLGNDYLITNPTSGTEVESISKGIYKVVPSEKGVHVHRDRDQFKLPEKILGTTHSDVARLIGNELLLGEEEPVGALLTGLKGMGKTDTLYYIANECINKSDYAVFIIEQYVPVVLLRILIEACKGKCVILIDEYGKKFSSPNEDGADESQEAESLLELLNDRSIGRTLFLLADNGTAKISSYMLNRPQRIKFHISYGSLPSDVIAEMTAGIDDMRYLNYLDQYVRMNKSAISYDVYRTVINVAHDCLDRGLDVAGLAKTLEYYNVPEFELKLPKISILIEPIEDESEGDRKRREEEALSLFNDLYSVDYDSSTNKVLLRSLSNGEAKEYDQSDSLTGVKLAEKVDFRLDWRSEHTLDNGKVTIEIKSHLVLSHTFTRWAQQMIS